MNKKVLTGIGVGVILLGGTFVADRIEEAKNSIEPLTFNGKEIILGYTDDNTNETLLIHTEKETYSSWDSSEVIFAIKNVSGSDQNVDIQILGARAETISSIDEFKPSIAKTKTVDDYAAEESCKNEYNPFTQRDENICRKEKVGSHQETYYVDEWQAVTEKTPRKITQSDRIHKEPDSFAVKKQVIYFIADGETKYFKTNLKFSAKSTGEFYIKAIGDNGGEGILDPWYSSSWLYRKSITIDHTKVSSSNQTDFPILVDLTDSNLQANAQSDGDDILFTSSDGTTKLDHEIELYTSASGRLTAWVRIPTLSTSVDTVIYMYYGNAGASNQQNVTGVWDSNYKLVWHLPNGSSLTTNDSTSVANNGTATNATATEGKVDGAAAVTGTGYVNTTSSSGWGSSVQALMTVEIWAKITSTDSSLRAAWRTNSNSIALYKDTDNVWKYYNGSFISTGLSATAGTWNHIVVTQDAFGVADNVKLYTNGSKVYDGAGHGVYGTSGIRTGGDEFGQNLNGAVDEFRISNIRRADSWILTEYNNESATSTFYTIGSQETDTPSVSPAGVTTIISGVVSILSGVTIIQ